MNLIDPCVDNRCVGATRASDQLSTSIAAYTRTPQQVIDMGIAYNDMRFGTNIDSWAATVEDIFDIWAGWDVPAYVGDCLYMNAAGYAAGAPTWNHGNDAAVAAFNARLAAVAANYPKVTIVHFPDYSTVSDVAVDNIHPNDTGHAKIGAAFKTAMCI